MTTFHKNPRLSVLNLAPVRQGATVKDALEQSLALARHVEQLGYNRFWVAEHHNMEGIASSATSVLIGHIAENTSSIRVGSGGIMLPNHPPLAIAEQFGTLSTLFPDRIDLGLGRAPGTDQLTAQALRRHGQDGNDFPELVNELQQYFHPTATGPRVKAVPGEGEDVPIWLLGSSGFSAQLAGQLGLPFAFAGHFSPKNTIPALNVYYDSFRPSNVLDDPYAMVAINAIAGETNEEAQYLASSLYQQFLSMIRNRRGKLAPPVEDMDQLWSPHEKEMVMEQLGGSFIGDAATLKEELLAFAEKTGVNELMLHTNLYDPEKQKQSFDSIAKAFQLTRE
ncbi:LLM class flavin-dependent oxidoreductase [Shouchella shacheensis]|uniref:LLM class flavin-dependent oxidoreductase n=1 Tax=Shouchella shacheensis TaxID=1649580 RepID=UPI00073FB5CB|nr:LLM class flavin-dependent oxidoreductase [Shouchella shacheensis]